MQLNAVSAPTLRADEAFRTQREAEAIAGAKTQIRALDGEESDEVAALGLKKGASE